MDHEELSALLWRIEETAGERKAEAFEAAAAELDPGDFGRSSLWVAAADHRHLRGETQRAHELLDRAEAEGGEPSDGVLPTRLDLALAEGDRPRADEVLRRLRAAASADTLIPLVYGRVAGVLEAHDDLRGALRWLTLPFTHADPDDDDLDRYCLARRYRLRRALGLGLDPFDRRAATEGLGGSR